MVRSAVFHTGSADAERSGTAWAAAVAILFAAIAIASLAVDFSLGVCPAGANLPHIGAGER